MIKSSKTKRILGFELDYEISSCVNLRATSGAKYCSASLDSADIRAILSLCSASTLESSCYALFFWRPTWTTRLSLSWLKKFWTAPSMTKCFPEALLSPFKTMKLPLLIGSAISILMWPEKSYSWTQFLLYGALDNFKWEKSNSIYSPFATSIPWTQLYNYPKPNLALYDD